MKLRNKEDKSKIGTLKVFYLSPDNEVGKLAVESSGTTYYYDSLGKVYAEWEDYEEPKKEPKKEWYLDGLGLPIKIVVGGDSFRQTLEAIGNYFETKEEAEKAVEKLKAWKRLKDAGFRFKGWNAIGEIGFSIGYNKFYSLMEDLDLLFGGEE